MNKNECSDLDFLVTLYFINVVLYFITFSWMVMLDKSKCVCGKNWRWTFIKYFIVVMFSIICTIAFIFTANVSTNTDDIFSYLKYGILIAEIIFVAIVFLNVRDLIKKGCNCQKVESDLVYDSVDIGICILSILMALILIIKKI